MSDKENKKIDEREICEDILTSALNDLIEHIATSPNDPRSAGAAYLASDGEAYLKELRTHIRQSIIQHEKELWDQARKRPFDRMLVKRFSHLFPSEGELGNGDNQLSRKILPGFFTAMEMMAGKELFEQCQQACKALVKNRKKERGDDFLWRDFYEEETPNELVNDAFAVIVPHFSDFEKRSQWLINLINTHLAPADDYAFEGDAVKGWHMDKEGLNLLLNALFSPFRERLETTEGREKVVQRYGIKASRALEDVLVNIGNEKAD
ncbi:MAG: hypothetical protein ISR45_06930 [Rhodospirillales bacterium]|nr:hypothetical protein [Rhodospirillales bacterium]